MKRWANRKQMFCNDNCRSSYWADYRYGLNAGLDQFTDQIAEAHYCLYCRMIVPYNHAKVSLVNGRLVIQP
jgi:hypothetical protein